MRLLIVPAAGRGSRLGAAVPKPFVTVAGISMLDRLVDLYDRHVERFLVVVNPSFVEDAREWGRRLPNVEIVEQRMPTGMLDAILCASPAVARLHPDWIWITWCDQIGVLPETVVRLETETAIAGPALVMPTVRRRHPYIHLARDSNGRITRILHLREGDEMPEEGESDMGLFALSRRAFEEGLTRYAREADVGLGTGERNFLPFIPWLAERATVATFPCTNAMEALGVNTPEDLRVMEGWLRERTR
jgi:bifunctional N-acetylglucosamine-1-phosphate-uridyltransferase/glucosamine-1-phosphate-acetyltransferase GlmU-like protein